MIKKLSKDKVKRLIDENRITVYYEDNWRYPATGDDQKTCPLLDVMFQIERRAGYIIHIPIVNIEDEKNKRQLKGQINLSEIKGE